jgi:hypothetical protein
MASLADVEERELAAVDLTVFAAGDASRTAAHDDRQRAPVHPPVLAAAEDIIHAPAVERQREVSDPPVEAPVEERQRGPLEPPQAAAGQMDSRAWIGVIAAVTLAAIAGVVIVLTMLVPKTPGHEGAAVDSRPAAAAPDARSAAVEKAAHARVPAAAMPSSWRSTDEWTGGRKKSVAYELAAERPVRVWMRQATPVLVVRCLAGTLDAFVVTGSASAIEPGRTDHGVRLAFDGGQPMTERWTDSADHDGLFAPDGPAVVARLASAHTLRFTFTPHNAPDAEAHFNVSGLEALRSKLNQHCRPR